MNGRRNSKPEGVKRFGVRSFGCGTNCRSFAFLTWIISRNRKAKEIQMFRGDIRDRVHRLSLTSKGGKLVGSVVKDVSMGRGRVRIDLVGEDLCMNSGKGKIKSKTAQIFRKHQAIEKLLARQVVGANMDEGSFETLAVENTMKDGHRFSVIRS
jgi:hypothetical protein